MAIPYKHWVLEEDSEPVTDKKFEIPVHRLKLREQSQPPGSSCRVYECGEASEESRINEKVILMVGGTGGGKTTTIDTLVNFYLNVDYDDNFRFKVVSEELNISQAHSQTRHITVYRLNFQKAFKMSHPLTIIDTPGFGDTGGIGRDEITVDLIYDFFSQDIVDHVDVIGFVEKSSALRLTSTQKYIFDCILSLFGNDLAENIFVLLTFSDAGKPRAILESLRSADIPFAEHFCFNNSVVFPESISHGDDVESDDAAAADIIANFWEKNMATFQRFTRKLEQAPAKNLAMSKDVLERRKHIKLSNQALYELVQAATFYLNQLRKEMETLKKHESDEEDNRHFTYEYEALEYTQNRLPDCCGTRILRFFFSLIELIPFVMLEAIPYRYEQRTVTKTGVYGEMKRKYEIAVGATLTLKGVIAEIQKKFELITRKIMAILGEMRENINVLERIALRNNTLSVVEYIDVLIAEISRSAKPGWQNQVEELTMFRRLAQQLMDVAAHDFDPFQAFSDIGDEDEMHPTVRAIWHNCRPHWFNY